MIGTVIGNLVVQLAADTSKYEKSLVQARHATENQAAAIKKADEKIIKAHMAFYEQTSAGIRKHSEGIKRAEEARVSLQGKIQTKGRQVAEKIAAAQEGTEATRLAHFGVMMAGGAAAVAAGIVAVGVASVRSFAAFDEAITRSAVSFGADGIRMKKQMGDVARAISLSSTTSANELAEAYGALHHAGFNAAQATQALGVAETFATAQGEDITHATKTLTEAQSLLGMRSADAGKNMENLRKVSNGLTRASQETGQTVEELVHMMGDASEGDLEKFRNMLQRVGEDSQAASDKMKEGFNAQLKTMENQITEVANRIGEALTPSLAVLNKVVETGLKQGWIAGLRRAVDEIGGAGVKLIEKVGGKGVLDKIFGAGATDAANKRADAEIAAQDRVNKEVVADAAKGIESHKVAFDLSKKKTDQEKKHAQAIHESTHAAGQFATISLRRFSLRGLGAATPRAVAAAGPLGAIADSIRGGGSGPRTAAERAKLEVSERQAILDRHAGQFVGAKDKQSEQNVMSFLMKGQMGRDTQSPEALLAAAYGKRPAVAGEFPTSVGPDSSMTLAQAREHGAQVREKEDKLQKLIDVTEKKRLGAPLR